MARTHRSGLLALLTLTTLSAACESTTAPDVGDDLDSEATLSAYQTMDTLLASPALIGFQALAGRIPFSGSASAVDATAVLGVTPTADGGRAFAQTLARRLGLVDSPASAPAAAPIISDAHRGKTFVYDPGEDRYVEEPEREGAPATGVRFVLYEVDPTGTPIVDEEIGYADLVDEGDDSAEDVALHLTVVAHDATVLEYRVGLDVQEVGGTLDVHGALQEPRGPRLDFDIEAQATRVGDVTTLDVSFDLSLQAADLSMVGTVSGLEEGAEGEGAVELAVRHGDDSIRLSVEGAGGQIDGSVFVNGSLFATIEGDASDPVIASATGDPLTLGELLVLHRIVDGVEDVFDFLEDLLDPVDELIILAIVL